MVEKVVQHKHCRSCGRAIQPTEEFCSEDCSEEFKTRLLRKKRQLLYLYIGSAIMIIFILLLTWGG